jgi:mono/diheme cytochrome c family protein
MSRAALAPSSRPTGLATVLLLSLLVAACGGGGEGSAEDTSMAQTPAGGAAGGAGGGGGADTAATPQLLALGDSIFHGRAAGGICFTCHGPDAKGTALAPDLTDATWINIDGSRAAIANLVRTGVLQPKQHPGPMPPFAGFTDRQLQAVAAYVYSLGHPGA